MQIELADAQATEALGRQLATGMHRGVVYLEGDLGAGKTALARAILHGRGYPGKVKSPTYTLVEPYRLGEEEIYHLDLYRLSDPEELEWLGVRDLLAETALLLIEWPERGAGQLPAPDLVIVLDHHNTGRMANMQPRTPLGHHMMGMLDSL
ncbi:MAG: tRNA (adenosine(37)-N6)-threonylcarbamoyltransferase complex ATPase subunit type 1 TsaE [Gammaproteobacteria bacterium]